MALEKLRDETARVIANSRVSDRLYVLELESPQIASAIQPGQFVHLLVPGMPDKLLRRPFSVYKADAAAGTFSILYQVVGAGTEVLASVASGAETSVIGPIGNTWTPPDTGNVLLVGGGVGAAPLFMLAASAASVDRRVTVVLGAQTKDALVTLDDYHALPNVDVVPATDDGSFGFAGFCTSPAQEAIDSGGFAWVACCGPEPLMRIVSGIALEAGLPVQVSLERRMACGVGACLSCVVDTVEGKKRCCVDGPIFNADEVVW